MPDISMCMSGNCPLRKQCYRNEASGTKPNPWRQSYAAFGLNGQGPCLDYVPARVEAQTPEGTGRMNPASGSSGLLEEPKE